MAPRGPAKRTGAEKSIRVATGSALERLTEGKPFTDTVHKMAALFETALAENWGPQPVYVGIDYGAPGGDVSVWIDDQGRELHEVGGKLVDPDPRRMAYGGGRALGKSEAVRQFLIGHDERTSQVVTEAELLALAAEQAPAGLVPIGLDEEADELPREVASEVLQDNITLADEGDFDLDSLA